MNIFEKTFKSLSKALIVGLVTFTVGAFAAGNSAHAADNAFKFNEKAHQQGITEAPAAVAQAKIPCEIKDAYFQGEAGIKKDGKVVKGKIYEVACKDGNGWMITIAPTGAEPPYNCTQAATYVTFNPNIPKCELEANKPHFGWLNVVAREEIADCEVKNARLVGSFSEGGKRDRYEILCTNNRVTLVDISAEDPNAPKSFRKCITVADSKTPCQYMDAASAINEIKPLAAAADSDCQVNNARVIAPSADGTGVYYEFGCSNKPGFVVFALNNGNYERTISCVGAKPLGGCKYTDSEAAALAEGAHYTQALASAGVKCTVKEMNVIGTQPQTNRSYAEFICDEQPFGVIGFVPNEGSTASVNVGDCFVDQVRRKACTYVTPDKLMAHWNKLLKDEVKTRNCELKEVRYIGEYEEEPDAIIAELACVNKRGFIAILSADRTKILETMTCKSARKDPKAIQCEIPDNGTFEADAQ